MGADLYLESIYDKNTAIYEPLFVEACALRDSLPRDSEAANEAQEKVQEYLQAWNGGGGYFRDSYNDSSLLWLLDLSWWQDITPLLDDSGGLPLADAERLVTTIESRMHSHYPEYFNEFCSSNPKDNVEEWDSFFKSKAEKLTAMLKQSIELGETIKCSL